MSAGDGAGLSPGPAGSVAVHADCQRNPDSRAVRLGRDSDESERSSEVPRLCRSARRRGAGAQGFVSSGKAAGWINRRDQQLSASGSRPAGGGPRRGRVHDQSVCGRPSITSGRWRSRPTESISFGSKLGWPDQPAEAIPWTAWLAPADEPGPRLEGIGVRRRWRLHPVNSPLGTVRKFL